MNDLILMGIGSFLIGALTSVCLVMYAPFLVEIWRDIKRLAKWLPSVFGGNNDRWF